MSETKSLNNKDIYTFANKKTEKLVTALYMVSDCMDAGDAIRNKLRLLGVELLSDTHTLVILSSVEKHTRITNACTKISEILSLVDIASTIGFVSEMNANILKKEFGLLVKELESYQKEKAVLSHLTLNEKMFDVPLPTEDVDNKGQIKDKRTSLFISPSFKHHPAFQAPLLKKDTRNTIDRPIRIMSLIKDKSKGQEGVSIKDISSAFLDCSEKTIQRDLNSLVAKGQIKKTGAKRWSRYSIL